MLRTESSNCPSSPPGGRQCRRCASSDISHIHTFSYFFRTVLFSLVPIFKFLQALPLGCDCAFHSGREHQDLLPPEGRIVSDTYISQKSQTSQIPCMSDVTDVKVNCDLLSHKGWQTESQWQGGQPSPRWVTSSTFLSFFLFSHFEFWF